MATKLTSESEIVRNTTFPHNGKEVIIKVTRHGVWTKFSGQAWKNAMFAPWSAVYDMSAKLTLGVSTQLKPKKANRGLLGVGG